MPKPRKQLISLNATRYYHCTSRCVRRAFLCGFDKFSGKSFEHRRHWIEDRILFLSSIFAIDICAHAVMTNHFHLVLYVNVENAYRLTDLDVCNKWHKIYKGTLLTHKFTKNEPLTSAEMAAVQEKIQQWRDQLCSISWFMRTLNEPIARMANAEDQCTGKFWEARFTSQALLDEKALLACMAYVDLNPIRARLADTPESSKYTSVKKRIEILKQNGEQPKALAPFVGNPRADMHDGLPFKLEDYLNLVDWTGRIIREDKLGSIPNQLPPLLSRLGFESNQWLILTTKFENKFKNIVGCTESIKQKVKAFGYKRLPSLHSSTILIT